MLIAVICLMVVIGVIATTVTTSYYGADIKWREPEFTIKHTAA